MWKKTPNLMAIQLWPSMLGAPPAHWGGVVLPAPLTELIYLSREFPLLILVKLTRSQSTHTHTHIYIYNVMDNSECSNRWRSRHMHPFAVEATRFLLAGSSSGWFDLACPSHCTFSWTFALAIFVAGFGLDALLVLAWTFHFWTPSCSVPASRPVPVPSPSGRLVAYLHERARFSPDRGH
jgi:hypothetical protein